MRAFRSNLRQMQLLKFKDLITTVMFSNTNDIAEFACKSGVVHRLSSHGSKAWLVQSDK